MAQGLKIRILDRHIFYHMLLICLISNLILLHFNRLYKVLFKFYFEILMTSINTYRLAIKIIHELAKALEENYHSKIL